MTKETSRQKRDTNPYRLGGQNAQNQAMRLDFPKLADAMAREIRVAISANYRCQSMDYSTMPSAGASDDVFPASRDAGRRRPAACFLRNTFLKSSG
jgi:hypothetical protein